MILKCKYRAIDGSIMSYIKTYDGRRKNARRQAIKEIMQSFAGSITPIIQIGTKKIKHIDRNALRQAQLCNQLSKLSPEGCNLI
jgi:hypothetical protein